MTGGSATLACGVRTERGLDRLLLSGLLLLFLSGPIERLVGRRTNRRRG